MEYGLVFQYMPGFGRLDVGAGSYRRGSAHILVCMAVKPPARHGGTPPAERKVRIERREGVKDKIVFGRIWRWAAALGIAVSGAGLLVHSAAVAQGIRSGLQVCAGVLIPSLFPFMVLSCLLSMSKYARLLSLPLAPLTRRILKLPEEFGFVVLLGMIGGYPVGAKAISGLLAQGRLDRRTAERMLCFCVNAGPSFLISAVGAGMFGDKRMGVLLFAVQCAATLLVGALVSLRCSPPPRTQKWEHAGQGSAAVFVSSVNAASSAMITMCAFAVLFSGALALLSASGLCGRLAGALRLDPLLVDAVAGGLLEVTAGCLRGAGIGGMAGFLLVCLSVSFGGISVLFQVMSCFHGTEVRFWPMALAKLLHGALSCAIALPAYKMLTADRPVSLLLRPPAIQTDSQTWLLSACLLCMCSILLLGGLQKR